MIVSVNKSAILNNYDRERVNYISSIYNDERVAINNNENI
jgi:hypothetical protein